MYNILNQTNLAIYNKTFTAGLAYYTQANCQITLTDIGYRIYRPPNLTPSADGNTMWGGLVIRPFSEDSNALIKNHSYILKFEVKGQTSNAVSDVYWTNNTGWSGGGLNPTPTDIITTSIPANWVSSEWYPFSYKFTILDDIYKVCTSSYSSFVAGQTYLSYRDFKFGFGYTATGALGTDLYIRNIRLYDITTLLNEIKVDRTGVVHAGNLVENSGNAAFKLDGDLYSSRFYEI